YNWVWVLLLKDSIPCPIPVDSEDGRSTAWLLTVKIQNGSGRAIINLSSSRQSASLVAVLLPKQHKTANDPPQDFIKS
ncbi:hypothetical protein, partial [Rhizobium sp. LjRoot30]|uniref:hypothetical protein n=1 Tax=Rhizobium sp. LjRoot30 TaxID=3342320 RepID=UPI003F50AA50